MLHILLLLLKIVGIILLVILGLVLLLLCILLFVPFRYRIEAKRYDKAGACVRLSYLFHLIVAEYTISYPGEEGGLIQACKLRLLGKVLFDPFAKKAEKKPKKKKKKEKASKEKTKKQTKEEKEKEIDEKNVPSGDVAGSAKDSTTDSSTESRIAGELPPPKEASFIERLIGKIRAVPGKVQGVLLGIQTKVTGILHTVQSLCQKKDELLALWSDEAFVKARADIQKELLYLWKHYRPRHIEGTLHFGFSDPSATGKCLAALSVLYPVYPPKLSLQADFEEEALEGELSISGRLRLYVLALIAFRIWRNKEIRQTYDEIRRFV